MNVNLLPFTILWVILATIVIGVLMYRWWISRDEDDSLHVMESETGVVSRQAAMAQKLESIDRWGKVLTVVALVYGLLLGLVYLYKAYIASLNSL
jgi:hypothetical protein